jgi:hypothetical protein
VRTNLYNLRRPICGDSQKSSTKCRGYLYAHHGVMKFKCHNCGVTEGLAEFANRLDAGLEAELLNNQGANTA